MSNCIPKQVNTDDHVMYRKKSDVRSANLFTPPSNFCPKKPFSFASEKKTQPTAISLQQSYGIDLPRFLWHAFMITLPCSTSKFDAIKKVLKADKAANRHGNVWSLLLIRSHPICRSYPSRAYWNNEIAVAQVSCLLSDPPYHPSAL